MIILESKEKKFLFLRAKTNGRARNTLDCCPTGRVIFYLKLIIRLRTGLNYRLTVKAKTFDSFSFFSNYFLHHFYNVFILLQFLAYLNQFEYSDIN